MKLIATLFGLVLLSGSLFAQPYRLGGDTIYYDPSNPPQVFKGGVVYGEAQSYLFRSGSFDFTNNLWLDESGNGYDAELIGGNCVDINADVTITTTVALTGKTVVSVNDNADFAGVAVSGANLVVDFSELTDTLLYKIILSDGQEFRLTTGVSKYIFAAANIGSLGGTENTEWKWAKTNSYHGNLQYGFTKAIYVNNTSNILAGTVPQNIFIHESDSVSIEWEGRLMEPVAILCNIGIVGQSYGYALTVSKTSNIVKFTTRTADKVTVIDTVADGVVDEYFKLILSYNGQGLDDKDNFKIIINGSVLSLSVGVNALEDRSGYYWSGNSASSHPEEFLSKFILSINGRKIKVIEDGVIYTANTLNDPSLIGYIPVFNNIDAFGQTPSNPAYVNAFNDCESKIKIPFDTNIFNLDENRYVYDTDSTSKDIDVSKLYPELGLLRCDNSNFKKVYNLTYLPKETTTWQSLHGFKPYSPLVSFRFDAGGPADTGYIYKGLSHVDDILNSHPYLHIDIHNTHTWGSDYWNEYINNGQIALGLHDFTPAFWQYSDSVEGYRAYQVATQTQKDNGTVTDDQGQIGAWANNIENAVITDVNDINETYGIDYPDGVPDSTDSNSEYWAWALHSMKRLVRQETPNANFYSFSYLGSLPYGINDIHYDVIPQIIDSFGWQDQYAKYIDNDIIGNAKGRGITEITSGDTTYIQLQGTGSSAYLAYYDTELFNYPNSKIQFEIKQTGGVTGIAIANLRNTENITISGANLVFNGVTYTNVLTGNHIYKIVIHNFRYYQEMYVYRNDSCLLVTTPFYSSNAGQNRFYIKITNADCNLYNISVRAYNMERSTDFYQLTNDYVLDGEYEPYGPVSRLDTIKKQTLNSVYSSVYPIAIFSHTLINPTTKADSATWEGTVDRTYQVANDFVNWAHNAGFTFANSRDIAENTVFGSLRENYFKNGDLSDSLHGVSGRIWGYNNLSKDATYTGNYSIDGSNVAKIPSGLSVSRSFKPKATGLHWIKFYGVGTFIIELFDNRRLNSSQEGTFTLSNFQFLRVPFTVENADILYNINIKASGGDCYIHKIVIE